MGRPFLCGLSRVTDYSCLTDDVHFDFSGVTELRFDGGAYQINILYCVQAIEPLRTIYFYHKVCYYLNLFFDMCSVCLP